MELKLPTAPLFVPASQPALFSKALASDADAVILDLEDAVSPQEKDQARQSVQSHGMIGKPVVIRINGAASTWFAADLHVLRSARFDALMLPKAESAAEIALMIETLGRDVPVIALIESARGLFALGDILSHPHVIGLGLGALDLALDLNCAPDFEPLLMARSDMVLRSRLAGRPGPIDGVTPDFQDLRRVANDAKRVRALGFSGKLAIHPKQVRPILDAMAPSGEDIAWARAVIATLDGDRLGVVDGAMVDAPVIARANHILDQQEKKDRSS